MRGTDVLFAKELLPLLPLRRLCLVKRPEALLLKVNEVHIVEEKMTWCITA